MFDTPLFLIGGAGNIGAHAIRWIHRAVLTEAKKLLADRRLTVQQVADEFFLPIPHSSGNSSRNTRA